MKQIEKSLEKKFKTINNRIKTSFTLIRKDVDEMQIIIDAMRKYLKKKDLEYTRRNDQHTKSQIELQKDIDEFTQKITQLKLAFSAVNATKQEVVIKRDLAQIEDRIKTSFKNEIERYKEETKNLRSELKESQKRIAALEKNQIYKEKKKWFFKKN